MKFRAWFQQIGVRLFLIIFISMDYTTYIKIIAIISRLFRLFFCKNFHDYTRLLHYLQKDDCFTYCNTIISLIVFGIYSGDYLYYIKIIRIIDIIAIFFYTPTYTLKWYTASDSGFNSRSAFVYIRGSYRSKYIAISRWLVHLRFGRHPQETGV